MKSVFEKTRYCGFNLPPSLVRDFQSSYPRLGTHFIRRCILRALNSRDFFNDVYFNTFDKYSDVGQNNPNYSLKIEG